MSTNPIGNQKPFSPSSILQTQGRPPIRSLSQVHGQSRQTPSRQVSFDISSFRSSEPTAKRIKLDHEGPAQWTREHVQGDAVATEAQTPRSTADPGREATHKLPPFPRRPGSHPSRTESPVYQSLQGREPVSSKPYTLDIPKTAPRYADKQPADFFPWTGDQPEDSLNENTIKNGYFDKSTTPQSETVHARNQIWSNVKHKSGLQSLSSLFITALQQRQKFGTAPPISTFKPPPRATLTESKREIWLKDLADADISLRRLSRTIPHGIRGKTLLDQCVSKRVPFERAIWLVKCVGANEIRAFKRKGPTANTSGSETKWISEWTINVEQFLIALIESRGTTDWKENLQYGLQLVAHVYAEYLLEKVHFLEWIISSLKAAPGFEIPIWLLIAQTYWYEFSSCRRYGKKLAMALCDHANQLYGNVVDANQGLWNDISAVIILLMETEMACFLFPEHWSIVSTALEAICHNHREMFIQIRQRNEEFEIYARMDKVSDPRQQIIDILDQSVTLLDIKKVSRDCRAACPSIDRVATTVCQWATTMYRPGFASMYLCLRLLRRWVKLDLDLESLIFSFIRSCSNRPDLDQLKLFRLVSELFRSKNISISRYLQWIMAQGSPLVLESELLGCLPLHGLPDHVQNLCQTVLGRPQSADLELPKLQTIIRERLFNDSIVDQPLDYDLVSQLSIAEQYRLTHWIRSLLFKTAEEDTQLASSDDLYLICSLLETTKDFAILADVLGLYADTGDVILLPIVSDMINEHFENLHAIGAAEDIYEIILDRMEEIPNRSPAQKPLIQSLVDLAARLPHRSKTLAVLQKELSLCEPKSAIAACSPVSDTMGDTQEDITFFEEIEMLFGSGTSMDRPLLARIFTDITKRLETSWTEDILTSCNLTEFLLRLRMFNREVFSALLENWMGTIMSRQGHIKVMFQIFICGGLINLQQLYIRLITQTNKTGPMAPTVLSEFLDLALERPNLPRAYHLQAQVTAMTRDHPKILLKFINLVIDKSGQSILHKAGVRELVRRLAINKNAVGEMFPDKNPAILADLAMNIPEEPAFSQQLPRMICHFNAILCAGKTRKLLAESTGTDLSGLPGALIENIMRKDDYLIEPWKRVIENLPRQTLLEMHRLSVTSILDSQSNHSLEREESLMTLVGFIQQKLDPVDMIATITSLSRLLSSDQDSSFDIDRKSDTFSATTGTHLHVILRMLAIHGNAFSQGQTSSHIGLRICLHLCTILLQPLTYSNDVIKRSILNTITSISDHISNEDRDQIVQAINKSGIHSSTLQFLFGATMQDTSDSNLELVTVPTVDIAHLLRDNLNATVEPPSTCVITPEAIKNRNVVPFILHRWEMVQDATPVIGENDTSLSLGLFGAKKAVL